MYDGLVRLPTTMPGLETLLAEFAAFPDGRHDDQVDAVCNVAANRELVVRRARLYGERLGRIRPIAPVVPPRPRSRAIRSFGTVGDNTATDKRIRQNGRTTMDFDNDGPRRAERSLTRQLKGKSRRRREGLERLRTPAPAQAPRNDPLPNLDLMYIPLEDLRLPTREIRKLDPAHVREVAAAISALGFCAPVLIGKDNAVIDGAVRVEAARQLGLDRIPAFEIEHLSETEQRLLRLAVNRLGEKGEWNLDELKIEFEELIFADAPIEISGFTLDEIDHIVLGEADDAIEEGPLAPEAGAIAVARLGDVFALGPHRIVCGSATDPDTVRRLMDGRRRRPPGSDRRTVQRADRGPCDRRPPSRVRHGLGRNDRRRIPRLQ